MRCDECKFWYRIKTSASGLCKKGPPAPLFLGYSQSLITEKKIPVVQSFWPELGEDRFCWGFEKKKEIVSAGTKAKRKKGDMN